MWPRVHPRAIVCSLPAKGGAASLNPWAEEIRKSGCPLFRQDETGAVHLLLEPDRLEARGFLNGQILTSRAR